MGTITPRLMPPCPTLKIHQFSSVQFAYMYGRCARLYVLISYSVRISWASLGGLGNSHHLELQKCVSANRENLRTCIGSDLANLDLLSPSSPQHQSRNAQLVELPPLQPLQQPQARLRLATSPSFTLHDDRLQLELADETLNEIQVPPLNGSFDVVQLHQPCGSTRALRANSDILG